MKQLLLESTECNTNTEDSIDDIIAKEKQKNDISDKITKVFQDIDSINARIKISKAERVKLSNQLTDIKERCHNNTKRKNGRPTLPIEAHKSTNFSLTSMQRK